MNVALQDVFGNVFTIGDKVLYNTTGQYAHLIHAEIVDIYEMTQYRRPITKVQIRKVSDDSDYKHKVVTLEYQSRRFYKL